MLSDPLQVVTKLADVFRGLGIPYFVGGSLASSIHGIPRATNDVDLAAAVKPLHVGRLAKVLEGEFYVAEELIAEAVRDRSSFNVIHLATMFKADIFVVGEDAWSRQQMSRARLETITSGPESQQLWFATPEDTILQKLLWFRKGGEVSEQQWKDILGVLKVQGRGLDLKYLEESAADLSIADLLQRAREDCP